jgi:hypothetical protein
MTRYFPASIAAMLLLAVATIAKGADAPKVGKLPHIDFDARTHQVRVECEMLDCSAPLEFFCCVKGSNDYEAMIRSEVKPSDLHLALLAIGLKPGQPLKYSEAAQKWLPPQGPPVQIMMEYQKDGKTVDDPGWRWMRDVHTKKPAPPFTWVFAGSRVLPDGKYAADITGYLVSIVNFDLTILDVPQLASSSNETLEWERNPDVTPKAGTKVIMILEPVGNNAPAAAQAQTPVLADAQAAPASSSPLSPIKVNTPTDADAQIAAAQANIDKLKQQWEQQLGPHRGELRQAAETHYKVIADLRAQQQKLIDAADKVQRTIDELEKDYQDLTTPRPESK